MKRVFATLICGLLLAISPAVVAQEEIRTEQVRFAAGATGTTIKDRIVGRESVSYTLSAEAGQIMMVTLMPSNAATYFNVYAPGRGPGDGALAVSEMTGPMVPSMNQFKGALPETGVYTVSVYLYRNAARRNEKSSYTLDVAIFPQNVDALVPGTGFNATGNIPCARAASQPMGNCAFGVVRQGNGNAVVTVFWPDGGSRVITFVKGSVMSYDKSEADGSAEIDASRNADLSIITIGEQRFEIPDAVVQGG